MRRAAAGLLLMAITALAAAGCGGDSAAETARGDGPLEVVTTVNFLTEAVRVIGGDHVTASSLMGPGVDPHLYKASAGDVSTLRDADLILYGGLELEGKMADLLGELADRQPTVAVFGAIPRDQLLIEKGRDVVDPHVWFDPALWRQAAASVRDALAEVAPDRKAAFDAGLARYEAMIDDAATEAQEALADVPQRRRVLVTSHDAFHYFGRAFDFEVVAIQGISTAAEATTADVQRVADVIVERELRSVFVESSVPRQTIEAVIAAARRGGQEVAVGGELFSDAAGEDSNWTTMLTSNARAVGEGLS